jgi:hypothetical protein
MDAGKTVIIGIDLNVDREKDVNGDGEHDFKDTIWHAVTIVKTPKSIFETWAPYLKGDEVYNVVDSLYQNYANPSPMNAAQFDKWLASYAGVYDEWLSGPGG